MTLLIAIFLIRGGGPITLFGIIVVALIAGAVMLEGVCQEMFRRWKKRTYGRSWPTVSAVVDVVSVAFIEDDIPSIRAYPNLSYYQATLTYTYRNPEPQMGDFRKGFGSKEEAQSWADSYKGETVKVHVDPRDPTRSVLREEDI
ncbi:MAG TPA: DUF3592 domain-containing protein [Terracidiphilus sp.]